METRESEKQNKHNTDLLMRFLLITAATNLYLNLRECKIEQTNNQTQTKTRRKHAPSRPACLSFREGIAGLPVLPEPDAGEAENRKIMKWSISDNNNKECINKQQTSNANNNYGATTNLLAEAKHQHRWSAWEQRQRLPGFVSMLVVLIELELQLFVVVLLVLRLLSFLRFCLPNSVEREVGLADDLVVAHQHHCRVELSCRAPTHNP